MSTLRVRLLPVGHDLPDLDTNPPLSYASLELLRLAETAKSSIPLEIHRIDNQKLYLIGVVALRDKAGQVKGVLHVTWDGGIITNEIKNFKSNVGQIALQQKVDNQFAIILGSTTAEHTKSRPLAASQMQIVYWDIGNVEMPLFIPSLLITGVLILIFGLILGLQYWRLNQAIVVDQATILKILEDVLAGRKLKPATVTVREFAGMIESLIKIINAATGKTIVSSVPQPQVATETKVQSKLVEETKVAETSTVAPTTEISTSTQVTSQPVDASKETKAAEPVVKPPATKTGRPVESATPANIEIPETLFRTYDIRGIITPALAYEIGRAIGSKLCELDQQVISVARDCRESSDSLTESLIEGLVNSGRDVINLGVVTTPIAYFATRYLESGAGIIVTAGRAPPEYNGFKILLDGEMIIEADLLAIRQLALNGPLWQGIGSQREQDLLPAYVERIADDVSIARPLKIVIDCGNGCTSLVAPQLFRTLGCEVIELYCELDCAYPNHQPDPIRPENLKALQTSVLAERADLGLAFDAEGDRIGVIDSRGRIIWPDRLLMALAADILTRNPGGDVVFDVNCSRALGDQILQHGGRPVMWRAGHPALKIKLRDLQALIAGDWSGHIIFQERWYGFDDACYAGARLLEILAVDPRTSAEFFDDFPDSVSTPEFTLRLRENEQKPLMKQLQNRAELLKGARLVTVDGIRAEYDDGWGVVRLSNTIAALHFRFEADNEKALERIQKSYKELLTAVAPKLKPPF
jgi:phosphomannomutase/phosphoglucomutase